MKQKKELKLIINEFDEKNIVERIILIGKNGAIRQIIFEENLE